MRGLGVALCIAGVGTLVGTAVPVGRSAGANVGEPAILFTRDYDLFWMRADGTRGARLTTAPSSDYSPARSPNGRKIAFTSTRTGLDQVWLMNVDGTGQARLSPPALRSASFPTWSPDGARIAFQGTQTGVPGVNIFVMNANGTGVVKLTSTPGGGRNILPAWSPDGKRIAFSSDRDEFANGYKRLRSQDIYVMNADGTNVQRLTNWGLTYQAGEIWASYPKWSPDGSKIAFERLVSSGPGNGNQRVFVMDADGTNRTAITNFRASGPAWSKTGARIAYSRGVTTNDTGGYQYDIYTMNPDGTGQTRLTDTPASEVGLAWRSG